MDNKFQDNLRRVFSILAVISIIGGAIIFVIFLIAFILGGSSGESLAVLNRGKIMPIFIRTSALAVLVGLIYSYASGRHAFSLDKEKE